MHKFTVRKKSLTVEEIRKFTNMNPGYIATGDTILHEYVDYYGLNGSEELVVFKPRDGKHNWTPYGMTRQTSKYFIIARYDRYYKLTHSGEIVSLDANDDNSDR